MVVVVVVVVAVFLAMKDVERMFDLSFPACAFLKIFFSGD